MEMNMPVSEQSYLSLAQSFGQSISDESQDFMLKINELKIDVAQSALAFYHGWETGHSFLDDMTTMDERDKTGKITAKFLDSLPKVGSEEPEDQAERQQWRLHTNHHADLFYTTTDKGFKRVSYFDQAASFTSNGGIIKAKLEAIKQIDANPLTGLPEGHPWHGYNDLTVAQRAVEKGYLQSQFNMITNMTRDAVHIYQQFQAFEEWELYRNKGFEIVPTRDQNGNVCRTKRPLTLIDNVVKANNPIPISVSQFLSINFPQAIEAHKRGVTPLMAIKATLKREAVDKGKGQVVLKSTSTVDQVEDAMWILHGWLTTGSSLKMFDHRMSDKKKGSSLREVSLRLYYEALQPVMDTPEHKLGWRGLQERDAVKAEVAMTTAPAEVGETPADKRKRMFAEAMANMKAIKAS
jgi:hypothetical protein